MRSAIYEQLAIRDLQGAADVLAGVFEQSGGRDGFVSMEVMPELAHKTGEHAGGGPRPTGSGSTGRTR